MIDQTIQDNLALPLAKERVKSRTNGRGGQLSYLETHDIIRTANAIFGFGGWGHEIMDLRPIEPVTVEKDGKQGVHVGYVCVVRLTVEGAITTSGIGYGDATEYQKTAMVTAHELAVKEAESDALKRALKNFGDQFGLALYDKQAASSGHLTTATQRPAATTATVERAGTAQVGEIERLIGQLNRENILTEALVRDGMLKEYGTEVTAELSKQQATEFAVRLSAKASQLVTA